MLVHDFDAFGFADMYAQIIAYGLLSARISEPENKTADDFAAHMRTNPFLKLMESFLRVGGRCGQAGGPGIDFAELGVSDVVQLRDATNSEAGARSLLTSRQAYQKDLANSNKASCMSLLGFRVEPAVT